MKTWMSLLLVIVLSGVIGAVLACGAESPDSPEPVASSSDGQAVMEVSMQEPPTSISGDPVGSLAPKFAGISNWINSEPLTVLGLRGKVVLIDFWTYTCVNCIRTLPYLREWNDKYADKGLVIVGVHTPEFDFEKVTANVVKATQDHGLSYPVAQDNDFETWSAYRNRYWPAKYLIDKDGVISYTHFGEGAYDETEQRIRDLLKETGADLSSVRINPDSGPEPHADAFTGNIENSLTRELYGGYERNRSFFGAYVGNQAYYDGPNMELLYQDPGDHDNNFFYLQGLWVNERERLRHGRETSNYEDYIAMKFYSSSVNVVLDPEDADPFRVMVTLDGQPLTEDTKGADVIIDDGMSYILVDEPRLFRIVELPEFGPHDLKLSSNSPDFALFAFTFGAYDQGP